MWRAPQIGGPKQGRPNFTDQLGQANGPLVGFAVAGGVTLAVGDVCMQFSVALLGLSVGPAAINALTMLQALMRSLISQHCSSGLTTVCMHPARLHGSRHAAVSPEAMLP